MVRELRGQAQRAFADAATGIEDQRRTAG